MEPMLNALLVRQLHADMHAIAERHRLVGAARRARGRSPRRRTIRTPLLSAPPATAAPPALGRAGIDR